MTFTTTFWGTRGSRPTPATTDHDTRRFGGNTSCVEVRTPSGDRIIFDSGTGLAELGKSIGDEPVDALILISHTHWDHIQGLPFFDPLFQKGTTLDIRGPHSSAASMASVLRTQMSKTFFPVRFDDSGAHLDVSDIDREEPFVWRGVTITPHLLNHTAPTLGYRLDLDGSSVVYATDNELRPLFEDADREGRRSRLGGLASWIAGTDLLIHDAQYSDEEYQRKRGWGHSTFSDARRLQEMTHAGRLALWHHDPAHSDADMELHVSECSTGRADIFAAAEGTSITIRDGTPLRD